MKPRFGHIIFKIQEGVLVALHSQVALEQKFAAYILEVVV